MTGLPLRLLATLLLISCGSDLTLPAGEAGPRIRVVEGDGGTGQAGQIVPVVVEVTNAEQQPISGASVAFALTAGGPDAGIAPQVATTDAAGKARAQMVLGSGAGVQSGDAQVLLEDQTGPKASFSVIVRAADPGNRSPSADFNWHCEELRCEFTDASEDPDGTLENWRWQFGDGDSSDQREPSHTFPASGTYAVTLTVTDDDGASDGTEGHVEVSGPAAQDNKAPHAEFEVHCSGRSCIFEDKSKDEDGDVVAWQWNFGDGSLPSSERNPAHVYQEKGRYPVMLSVTDDRGAIDVKVHNADPKD